MVYSKEILSLASADVQQGRESMQDGRASTALLEEKDRPSPCTRHRIRGRRWWRDTILLRCRAANDVGRQGRTASQTPVQPRVDTCKPYHPGDTKEKRKK